MKSAPFASVKHTETGADAAPAHNGQSVRLVNGTPGSALGQVAGGVDGGLSVGRGHPRNLLFRLTHVRGSGGGVGGWGLGVGGKLLHRRGVSVHACV